MNNNPIVMGVGATDWVLKKYKGDPATTPAYEIEGMRGGVKYRKTYNEGTKEYEDAPCP